MLHCIYRGIKKDCILLATLSIMPYICAMKKVWIKSEREYGVFTSKKRYYEIGSVVAISEPYCLICERLGRSYVEFLSKELGVSEDDLPCVKGWTNRKDAKAELMPRRVRIVEVKVKRVSDISDEEWELMGASDDEKSREACVGRDSWLWNSYLRLYRYEKD